MSNVKFPSHEDITSGNVSNKTVITHEFVVKELGDAILSVVGKMVLNHSLNKKDWQEASVDVMRTPGVDYYVVQLGQWIGPLYNRLIGLDKTLLTDVGAYVRSAIKEAGWSDVLLLNESPANLPWGNMGQPLFVSSMDHPAGPGSTNFNYGARLPPHLSHPMQPRPAVPPGLNNVFYNVDKIILIKRADQHEPDSSSEDKEFFIDFKDGKERGAFVKQGVFVKVDKNNLETFNAFAEYLETLGISAKQVKLK